MMRVVVGTPKVDSKNKTPTETLEWEKLSMEEILAHATTASLLGDVNHFELRGALSNERAEEFFEVGEVFLVSEHHFTFLEEKLLKKPLDRLKKLGVTPEVHEAPKKAEAFNVFSLTFALGARDRKKLWLLLTEALRTGIMPEAITGILHWKVRDMLTKQMFSSTPAPGKYTREELVGVSKALVVLYHEGHRGGGDLTLLLERFVLSL
jgi:hypothetical protein